MKLLRTIRLDPSDTFVFEHAAEPGEWAVPGAFVFWNEDVLQLEGKARSKEILEGMESASSYFRRVLATRVELRAFPRLRFHWDPTPEPAEHIERLLAKIREETPGAEEKK